NPRIVYGSISGFGQDGPYATRAGFDQIAQGMGGLMSITGLPGQGPVRAGIPVADLTAGLSLAQGILLALIERGQSGEGQWVHTSLLEAQIAMLDFQAARWLVGGEVPGQAGNDHPTSIPTGVFPTADGHINIAVAGNAIWNRFLEVIGHPEWNDDPGFATPGARSKNRVAVNAAISEVTRQRSGAEWIAILAEAGVPAGPIYAIDEVFADPQVQHLEMARPMTHPALGETRVVGQAINLSRTPEPPAVRPTPEQGEHTDEVLGELGYDAAAIAALRDGGVV
ncbi:MAG TPA: CaiB/BaiF CoA-transferase family protein, partial [Alphaproteobacteria bacterium]|nr:CaiB/BaiF CoA-transferase family protein [Alphaproteobacteria bacterium]